jgi:hypothetical protein
MVKERQALNLYPFPLTLSLLSLPVSVFDEDVFLIKSARSRGAV